MQSFLDVLPSPPLANLAHCSQSDSLCAIAAQVAATQFGIPANEIYAPCRRAAPVSRARQIAMYLAHIVFGLTFAGVGHGFGRDRTTVAHACRVIEDSRDDAALDALMCQLEMRCRTAAAAMAFARINDGAVQ